MNGSEIKTELHKLIDDQYDLSLLEAVHTLLKKASLDKTLQEKLSKRAMKSEADIKEGRLFSKEEAIKRTDLSMQ